MGRTRWRSLGDRRSFKCVYEEGVKKAGRLFVVFVYPGDDPARAVVASRKVGGAVTRNRAKRLLREAIGSLLERVPGSSRELRQRFFPAASPGDGIWIVAVARREMVTAGIGDVVEEFSRLLDLPPDRSTGPSTTDPVDPAGGYASRHGARG